MKNATDVYIVDGNITVFFGLHAETFKQDILHSSLLGSLATNKKSTTRHDWFNVYKSMLQKIFWVTKSFSIKQNEVTPASLLGLTSTALAAYLSKNQLIELENCFTTLKNLPDDSIELQAILDRIQFNGDADEPETITLHPMLTIVCENKMVISLNITFDINQTVDKSIFDEILIPTTGPKNIQWIAILDEEHYALVRDTVMTKIENKIETALLHLDAQPT